MTSTEAIQAELQRRSAMWDAVQSIQKERPLTADEVREIGCYNGARGIWRDKASTAHSPGFRKVVTPLIHPSGGLRT